MIQRHVFVAALIATAMSLQPAQAGGETLEVAVAADLSYLHDLYIELHKNPELSYHEEKSSARMAAEIRGIGFEVTEKVGGFGIVGVLENGPGPTVLIRADMDALPVKEMTGLEYASLAMGLNDDGLEVPVMHACGHDIHMTVFVGTARRLAAMKNQWSGTLVMIGQPAEERGGGAKAMLEDGLFERFPRPDFNLALHTDSTLPAGMLGFTPGWALANVDSVDITVRGIGGHGSTPHMTKDPIVLASQIVLALQTIVSREIAPQTPAVVTVGSIHGGLKHNIISDEVKLQITVRSYSDEVRAKLLASIERIAVDMGRVAGLPEELLPIYYHQDDEFTPSTYNDPALTERLMARLSDVVSGGVIKMPAVMGGEDFSRYGRQDPKIPSVMFWLGGVDPAKFEAAKSAGTQLPSLHSSLFAPLPDPTITTGVNAMTTAALELFDKR
jgi:hippurate hydrolase